MNKMWLWNDLNLRQNQCYFDFVFQVVHWIHGNILVRMDISSRRTHSSDGIPCGLHTHGIVGGWPVSGMHPRSHMERCGWPGYRSWHCFDWFGSLSHTCENNSIPVLFTLTLPFSTSSNDICSALGRSVPQLPHAHMTCLIKWTLLNF